MMKVFIETHISKQVVDWVNEIRVAWVDELNVQIKMLRRYFPILELLDQYEDLGKKSKIKGSFRNK